MWRDAAQAYLSSVSHFESSFFNLHLLSFVFRHIISLFQAKWGSDERLIGNKSSEAIQFVSITNFSLRFIFSTLLSTHTLYMHYIYICILLYTVPFANLRNECEIILSVGIWIVVFFIYFSVFLCCLNIFSISAFIRI